MMLKRVIWLLVIVMGMVVISGCGSAKVTSNNLNNVLKVGDVEITEGHGYITINASVTNLSSRPIRYFEVAALIVDTNGKVIDSAIANSDEMINPGNAKKIEIMAKGDKNFMGAKVFATKVIFLN